MTVKNESEPRQQAPSARIAAGDLARGVCRQMVRPLRELREELAVMVENLDRHVGEAKGPRGLTWKEVDALRQTLAECYLRCRDTARLASELAQAVDRDPTVSPVDLNKLVEAALNLARHRIREETEVFVDLGSLPMVRAAAPELMLALARVLCLAADSARQVEGAAISIRTRRDGDWVNVNIADNGGGRPDDLDEVGSIVADALIAGGGQYDGTSEPGAGSAFELRFPVAR